MSLQEVVGQHQIVVVSKDYCPFCKRVLGMLSKYQAQGTEVFVLDAVKNPDWQAQNVELTGQSTVPSVFVNGKHIGGCDDSMALHNNGGLCKMLGQ